MKQYQEAKRELLNNVKALENTIKFLKANAYYEDYCDFCHNIMKVKIIRYGEPQKFCTNKCRSQSYNNKKRGEKQ